ncbi:hypothetical protein HYQ46_009747 [Verticillium longisporum]|nr:hypothetical protein HYQ46_009747 [Verticillium longisporum]
MTEGTQPSGDAKLVDTQTSGKSLLTPAPSLLHAYMRPGPWRAIRLPPGALSRGAQGDVSKGGIIPSRVHREVILCPSVLVGSCRRSECDSPGLK